MMFVFQISSYDSSALDTETAELLRQRLEAHSRRTVPGIWKVTDGLNAYAAKGPGREKRRRRYRVYGILLLFLGIFALVPGLTEPRTPSLIATGSIAVLAGFSEFCLGRAKRPARIPASCQREAAALLAKRRAVDWSENPVKVCFDESGMTISAAENRRTVPYDKISGIFAAEHLWLIVYEDEKALLLQKKDCVEAEEFSLYIRSKLRTKAE